MANKALRDFKDTLKCPECGNWTTGFDCRNFFGPVSAVHTEGLFKRRYYVERMCLNIEKHGFLNCPTIKFYLTKEQAKFWKKNEFELDRIEVEVKEDEGKHVR